jgi:hypothetical protein
MAAQDLLGKPTAEEGHHSPIAAGDDVHMDGPDTPGQIDHIPARSSITRDQNGRGIGVTCPALAGLGNAAEHRQQPVAPR